MGADVVHGLSACEVGGVLTGGLILLYCGPFAAAATLAALQLVALAAAQLLLCLPRKRPEHAPPALLQHNGIAVLEAADPLPVWDAEADPAGGQLPSEVPPALVRRMSSTASWHVFFCVAGRLTAVAAFDSLLYSQSRGHLEAVNLLFADLAHHTCCDQVVTL